MAESRHPDSVERAERSGMEDRPGSETSRGTTPIAHGSIGQPTQNHEAAAEMIHGETDTSEGESEESGAAGHSHRAPERTTCDPAPRSER